MPSSIFSDIYFLIERTLIPSSIFFSRAVRIASFVRSHSHGSYSPIVNSPIAKCDEP
jgi:hypothetical protein